MLLAALGFISMSRCWRVCANDVAADDPVTRLTPCLGSSVYKDVLAQAVQSARATRLTLMAAKPAIRAERGQSPNLSLETKNPRPLAIVGAAEGSREGCKRCCLPIVLGFLPIRIGQHGHLWAATRQVSTLLPSSLTLSTASDLQITLLDTIASQHKPCNALRGKLSAAQHQHSCEWPVPRQGIAEGTHSKEKASFEMPGKRR